jgi:hypothetical protein
VPLEAGGKQRHCESLARGSGTTARFPREGSGRELFARSGVRRDDEFARCAARNCH